MPLEDASVTVYGADWCSVTQATRQHLDSMDVPYTYVDTDTDPEASRWVKDQNNGLEIKPTLNISGHILTAPDSDELDMVLREKGLLRAA